MAGRRCSCAISTPASHGPRKSSARSPLPQPRQWLHGSGGPCARSRARIRQHQPPAEEVGSSTCYGPLHDVVRHAEILQSTAWCARDTSGTSLHQYKLARMCAASAGIWIQEHLITTEEANTTPSTRGLLHGGQWYVPALLYSSGLNCRQQQAGDTGPSVSSRTHTKMVLHVQHEYAASAVTVVKITMDEPRLVKRRRYFLQQ